MPTRWKQLEDYDNHIDVLCALDMRYVNDGPKRDLHTTMPPSYCVLHTYMIDIKNAPTENKHTTVGVRW